MVTVAVPHYLSQRFWRFCHLFCSTSEIIRYCTASMMGGNTFRCCRTSYLVLHPSKPFPRAFWSTPREPLICPPTPATVTWQAQSRFRCYSSTRVSSSLSTDAMATDVKRAQPMEMKGQSGRQYRIKRVLQDKGSLLGRVLLASYVILNRVSMGY